MKKPKQVVLGKPSKYSASAIKGENNSAYFEVRRYEDLEEGARKVIKSWGREYQGYKDVQEYYLVDVDLIVDNQLVNVKAGHLTYLHRYLRTHNVTRYMANHSHRNNIDYWFRVDDLLIMRGLKQRDPKRHKDWV